MAEPADVDLAARALADLAFGPGDDTMTHTAIIQRIDDVHGVRAVVTHADDVIWIADELMAQAYDPHQERITGDLEVDGDLLMFGTVGEGLGRLTYRLVGYDGEHGWHIARREDTDR